MLESRASQPTPYRYAAYLSLLFAAEALVFYVQMAEQIAPYFPKNFDQTGYINYTYQLFETIRDRGWVSILSEIANPPTATGTALIVQGAVIAFFGGPNRTALASLNLIYFIILQLFVFQTIRNRTRSIYLALIAIALLLSMPTIFSPAGGIFDFRMDFVAFCLYGIWACLIIWSRCLTNTRVTAVLTAVAILLIATRSFTVIYIGSVLIGLLIHSLVDIRRAADKVSRDRAVHRARNIFWSGVFVGMVALPILFAARQKLYEKYVVGHVLNDEKYIRAQEMDLHSIADHLLFYPKSIFLDHIGQPAQWLALALVAFTVAGASRVRRGELGQTIKHLHRNSADFVALAITILIPISFLTIDIAKSTVVGGIVVIPVLLAAILLIEAICPSPWKLSNFGFGSLPATKGNTSSQPTLRTMQAALPMMACAGVFIFSLAAFVMHANVRQHEMQPADLEKVAALNETIASIAIGNGLKNPATSVDRIADYLNVHTIELTAYERFRRIVRFRRGMLGDDIFGASRETALQLLADSDIVVLTDPVLGRGSPYPINTAIRQYWDDLRSWAAQNMVTLDQLEIAGISHVVFAKPSVKITGLSGDWITSAGITITVAPNDLQHWSFLILEGDAPYDVLGGEPQPRAAVLTEQNGNVELPATLKRTNNTYLITIDTRAIKSSNASSVRIRLTFDRSFIPNKLGINSDTRELVVMSPSRSELRTAP
jgi:hypothetical protein